MNESESWWQTHNAGDAGPAISRLSLQLFETLSHLLYLGLSLCFVDKFLSFCPFVRFYNLYFYVHWMYLLHYYDMHWPCSVLLCCWDIMLQFYVSYCLVSLCLIAAPIGSRETTSHFKRMLVCVWIDHKHSLRLSLLPYSVSFLMLSFLPVRASLFHFSPLYPVHAPFPVHGIMWRLQIINEGKFWLIRTGVL